MNSFRVDSAKDTRSGMGVMLPGVELVIAIGLFTIISIFLIRFFTSANTMSRQADDLSNALIKAESAIELSKTISPEEVAKELGGKLTETEKGRVIEAYYDKNWNQASGDYKYLLSLTITDMPYGNGVLSEMRVWVHRKEINNDSTVIVDVEGAKYSKGGK